MGLILWYSILVYWCSISTLIWVPGLVLAAPFSFQFLGYRLGKHHKITQALEPLYPRARPGGSSWLRPSSVICGHLGNGDLSPSLPLSL